MRAVSLLVDPRLANSSGPHSSMNLDVKSSAKDVVLVQSDQDTTGQGVAARLSDPQTLEPEKL